MKGDEVVEDGTIVVENNRIKAVGPRASVTVPAGAKTVDVAGRTIIPGLIDEHAHLHYSTLDIFPQQPWKYAANLAYGVTTTHDPSASTHEAFGQSEMVEAGIMKGPRIFSTGLHPLRRRQLRPRRHREPGRRAQARAPAEDGGRLLREVVHAAAARAAAVDHPGRA